MKLAHVEAGHWDDMPPVFSGGGAETGFDTCAPLSLTGEGFPFTDLGLDPIGQALGFGPQGYHRFATAEGIGGLAKWSSDKLEILAIHSEFQGQGYLRRFIRRCQERFTTICVWHIGNSNLGSALSRYGFAPETEIDGSGEVLEGMRWDR